MLAAKTKKMLWRRRGQAMMEYLILLTSMLVVLIVFVGSMSSFFANSYNSALSRSTNAIFVRVNQIIMQQ